MMCTFCGLFGISTILFSLNDSSTLPAQNPFYTLNLDYNKFKSIFAGGITGAILGFLPGFGPAQGTIIAQAASGTNDNEDDDTVNFLLATSGLNISDCLFSLIAIYIIGNPRSGIAVYMSYLISEMNINHLEILYVFIFYYEAPVVYMTIALITSTALGMLPHYIGVGKSHLMGVLIIPAIVIYMKMFI